MLIDAHCHLTDEKFLAIGGVETVITQAKANGVGCFICSGYDIPSSQKAKELSEKYEEVYFCAGYQPEEVDKYEDGDFIRLEELLKSKKCVAVGEIGLDYHFDDNPSKEKQKEFFIKQLKNANAYSLPVVIHSRDACADTLEILNSIPLKKGGLMHCYSYSVESLIEYEKLGLYFSFGGTSTFKNARKVKESAAKVRADRILTETDSPYLTPEPFRGVFPNQPKYIGHVVKNLSKLREIEEELFIRQVEENTKNLFTAIKG